MSSVHHRVARSQLKPFLIPDNSMYHSKFFPRQGPIDVEGEQVWVEEKIVDNRKKNPCQ
jgi:hypothetical protein